MSEVKRPARVRRPTTFGSDEQADIYGNIGLSTKKENKQQTFTSAALSKLLVKFINQVNQDYRERNKNSKKQKIEQESKGISVAPKIPPKEQTIESQPKKMLTNAKLESQRQAIKKSKDVYNFKNSGLGNEQKKTLAAISSQRSNPSSSIAGVNPLQLGVLMQNSALLVQQLNYLHDKFPQLKEYLKIPNNYNIGSSAIQLGNLASLTPEALAGLTNHINQMKMNVPQNLPQNFRDNIILGQNKKSQSQDKLFKRSSYHVAIAYDIYLKKLQAAKKGSSKLVDIDPTYHAKKLRQQRLKQYTESNNKTSN